MKLYKIYQNINNDYDTYDSAIVAAETEEEAKSIHPNGDNNDWEEGYNYTWCNSPKEVQVEYIGIAIKGTIPGVIVASFNAG